MRTINVLSWFTRPSSTAGAINFANALDRTHQEFKAECDINAIMKKYESTGVMPQPWKSPPQPMWDDFASAPEYLDAQNMVIEARERFSQLPARVRGRFNNDPAALLNFVADPANLEEARSLGLANPVPAPPPDTTTPPPPKGG